MRIWRSIACGVARLSVCGLALGGLGAGLGDAPAAGPRAAPATQPATRQAIRVATAKDLQVILFATQDPEHHFPNAVVKIYNIADEDVIVGYEPGSIVVHCGDYQKPGPAVTFVHRREILSPHQPLEIAIAPGGWTRTNSAGERELMLPTDLPAGRYQVWASFHVEGDSAIESRHEEYEVP